MAIIKNITSSEATNVVNAVCVDVEDLGVVETPYGEKPQIKFAFESDQLDQYGEQRLLIRIFNNYALPSSALTLAMKSWCGRDLVEEKKNGVVNLKSQIGQQAKLKLESVPTKSGNTFEKIVEILSPGDVRVEPMKGQSRS